MMNFVLIIDGFETEKDYEKFIKNIEKNFKKLASQPYSKLKKVKNKNALRSNK